MTDIAWLPSDAPQSRRLPPGVLLVSDTAEPCKLALQFSFFFDGTRNHKEEDRPTGSHSNVARLFDACTENELNCQFRFYVQGVGTPCPEIGEIEPHPDGAKAGVMGWERLRYAMVFLCNRLAFVLNKQRIVPESNAAIAKAVSSDRNIADWRRQIERMKIERSGKVSIESITFDLFGFSRGATAARAFLNLVRKHFGDGKNEFCGIPLRVRFMGLFDTVASVGMADSYPFRVEGHQYWGDEWLLKIPAEVEQCVQMSAAHEGRASFPLDLVRGPTGYASNCLEIFYPGMHADVGGGYGPRSQGKGTRVGNSFRQSSADMLSQIPLNDMYVRAMKAGVPLLSREELYGSIVSDDFKASVELQSHFNAYMQAIPGLQGGAPGARHMLTHRRAYLGWRKHILEPGTFPSLPFVVRSSEQERVDLVEANAELNVEVGELDRATPSAKPTRNWYPHRNDWVPAPKPSPAVREFLEHYVHDSRAHFLLTDPQSERDHQVLAARLERLEKEYQQQRVAYEERMAAAREAAAKGQVPMGRPDVNPPVDPLDTASRKVMAIYRRKQKPIYSDAYPASDTDGILNATDAAAVFGRREPLWSYMRRRQLFAGARIAYEDGFR